MSQQDDPRAQLDRAIEQVGPREVLRAIRGERIIFPGPFNPSQEQAVYRRITTAMERLDDRAIEDVFEDNGYAVDLSETEVLPEKSEEVRIMKSGGIGSHDYDAEGIGLWAGLVPRDIIEEALEAVYVALDGIGPYIPDDTPVAVVRYDDADDAADLELTYRPWQNPAREVGSYTYHGETWRRNHKPGKPLRSGVTRPVGPFRRQPLEDLEEIRKDLAAMDDAVFEPIKEQEDARQYGVIVERGIVRRYTWSAPTDYDDIVRIQSLPNTGLVNSFREIARERGLEFGPYTGTIRAGPYIYGSSGDLIAFDLGYIQDNWRASSAEDMKVCIDVLQLGRDKMPEGAGDRWAIALSIRANPFGSNDDNAIYIVRGEYGEPIEAFNRAYHWMTGENPNALMTDVLETLDTDPDLLYAVEDMAGATAQETKATVAAEMNRAQAQLDRETEGLGSEEDEEAMTERTGGDPTDEEDDKSDFGLSPDTGERRSRGRGSTESASDDDSESMSLTDFGASSGERRSSERREQSSLTGDTDVDERDVFSNREDSTRRRREREEREKRARSRRQRQGDTDITRFSGDDLSRFEVGSGLDEDQALAVDAVVAFYEENITGDAGSIPDTLGVRLTRKAQDGADLVGDFAGVVEPTIAEVAQQEDFPDMASDRALDMVVDAINDALEAGEVR